MEGTHTLFQHFQTVTVILLNITCFMKMQFHCHQFLAKYHKQLFLLRQEIFNSPGRNVSLGASSVLNYKSYMLKMNKHKKKSGNGMVQF